MTIINLGIMAHVDAGKTSLTERLLFEAGVIRAIGRVDDGTTQTDSLALERQRGITIKSAVVSFDMHGKTINLIDTPGHPDFIAEVERVLSVLDGAILVISAVEGVQAQTRILYRALQRLRIPTVLFINKIDRRGADVERVCRQIAETLSAAILPLAKAGDLGSPAAWSTPRDTADPAFRDELLDLLSTNDEALLAAYVGDQAALSWDMLHASLVGQTRESGVHPVVFGSAMTGTGVSQVMEAITTFLPPSGADSGGPLSATVFKVERGPAGEKIAYVRVFSGSIAVRDRVPVERRDDERVTALRVFEQGGAAQHSCVRAGQIAKIWGLAGVQIGDVIGARPPGSRRHAFALPTLETIIVPKSAAHRTALHAALAQLAEQDPLINLRHDEMHQELFVSLYGEVQKEVVEATLAADYGIEVAFRASTTICVERPVGVGEAVDLIGKNDNPFIAGLGLRVEPGPRDGGIELRLDVKPDSMPLYVYKSVDLFQEAMLETVRDVLEQGLNGWRVTDCLVTMTYSDYISPSSTSRDFRLLTPLVLMAALQQAGTEVCEPIHRFHLEAPADSFGRMLPVFAHLEAAPDAPQLRGSLCLVDGDIPAARVHELQQQLPGLTHGEGVLEYAFDHYRPVHGPPPSRARTDANPLNRKEYLATIGRRR